MMPKDGDGARRYQHKEALPNTPNPHQEHYHYGIIATPIQDTQQHYNKNQKSPPWINKATPPTIRIRQKQGK